MSKRNTYLDLSDDNREDLGSGSEREEAEDSRLSSLRFKRRKLSGSDDESSHAGSGNERRLPHVTDKIFDQKLRTVDAHNNENGSLDQQDSPYGQSSRASSTAGDGQPIAADRKIITKLKLAKAQRKIRKTGVIYISRIPPFMKPSTLRQLLSPYGVLLRIFLTPEPAPRYQARVKAGGNKKKSFIDGWVEFESKREAKVCADALNGNIVGGKKGGFYHDDLWNIKYLKGFKWNDLMEQVQGEEREREGKLQAEIERERRERKLFLRNAERAKIERGIEAKRKRQRGSPTIGSKSDEHVPQSSDRSDSTKRPGGFNMIFKQNSVRSGSDAAAATREMKTQALRKIF